MRLLAIETSSRLSSVALHDGTSLIGQKSFAHGLQNAARLLPLIDELCREHALAPGDLTDIAVSIGPGSFTGLRIGVTLAKTLAFSTGAHLLAVPTLPVIAHNAPADAAYVLPILDAKRDQVFAALYQRSGHRLDEIRPPELIHLPDLLAQAPRPLVVLGEGINAHKHHLFADADPETPLAQRTPRSPDITCVPEELWYPNAPTVAAFALILKQQGAYADPFKLTPLYLRKPEAQERMEAGLLKHLEA